MTAATREAPGSSCPARRPFLARTALVEYESVERFIDTSGVNARTGCGGPKWTRYRGGIGWMTWQGKLPLMFFPVVCHVLQADPTKSSSVGVDIVQPSPPPSADAT